MALLFRCVVLALLYWHAPAAFAQRLPAGLSAVTSVEGIDEYRLANGLQVLLVPDDSKPTTTVNLTYLVGSRHEGYGETGMAHLLEHLLFKGSPKHPKAWAEFTKRGLAANGSTWFDRTNYTASFSANDANLDWYVGWLADSMVNSHIARKDLDTEMTVVRNEMEMGENSPQRILFQRTLALMYDWHNYGKDTIGARSDVENVDIPRLRAFYRRYYQPDNATLIVAGKFRPQRVLEQVAAAFGKLRRPQRSLPTQYTLDLAQDGERHVSLRRSGGVPMMMAAYHVPPGPHPDFAAVDLLALILGDAPSGRLHKRLTEKRLTASTFGYAPALADPSLLVLGAQLAPGQDVEVARGELLSTIETVSREPITQEELDRARTRWLASWEQSFTNPEAIGLSMSESIAQGDWRLFFLSRDRVRDIRLEDVQRVAGQHLLPSNRTLATYLPTDQPRRAPTPVRVDLARTLKDFQPQSAAAKVESFDATPANIEARTQRFAVGGIQAAVLPKGTRGQAVKAVLSLHFGDETSLFGQGEAASFAAALLDKGTTSLTREQLQDRLDQLKTELAINGTAEGVTLALSSRREHLPGAIALLGEMLRRPAFKAESFDEYRRQVLSSIEEQRKEPGALTMNALERHANPYPRGDVRYESSFDEEVEDAKAVTVDQVRAFHVKFYGLAKAEFAAVGDLDIAQVKAALQSAFGDWVGGAPHARVPSPFIAPKPDRLMLAAPDKQNATLRMRLPVPLSDKDADYPALMMANHLLGSGGNSRLWKRIREVEGLSYDVRSVLRWSQHEAHSIWQASAIFAPQNAAKVEVALREEIARALKHGFSAGELDEGRRGLLNFRRLSRAQDASIAAGLATNLYLDRTFAVSERIDAAIASLSLAQVNAALRKYIRPPDFAFAIAGDFKS